MFKFLAITLGLILGVMALIFSFAFLGLGLDKAGQGDSAASLTTATSGSHWNVVSIPIGTSGGPDWKPFFPSESERENLRQTMQEMVDQYKLPADEFMGLLQKESSGNPNVCSIVGARGLGQFMADTAREYSEFGESVDERGTVANRCNPLRSVRAAAHFMSDLRRANGGSDWGSLKDAYLGVRLPGGKFKARAYNPGADPKTWEDIAQFAQLFRQKGYVVAIEPVSGGGGEAKAGSYWQALIDEAIKLGSANNGQGTPVSQINGAFSRTSLTCSGGLSRMMARVQIQSGKYSDDEIIDKADRCIDLFRALTEGRWAGRVIAGSYVDGQPTGPKLGDLINQNQVPYGALVYKVVGPARGDHVFMYLGLDDNKKIKRAGAGGPNWVIDTSNSLASYGQYPAIVVIPDVGIWER